LSLSVFAKEFSSPTSLRPSSLATTTDQFLVIAENGSAIIKSHVQATNFVKVRFLSQFVTECVCR
jgi:hypothetical protein